MSTADYIHNLRTTLSYPIAERIDDRDPDCIYHGWAEIGTADSDAKWRICRVQRVNGVIEIRWASGDHGMLNVWADWNLYTYV
jgi:hypothetical protein